MLCAGPKGGGVFLRRPSTRHITVYQSVPLSRLCYVSYQSHLDHGSYILVTGLIAFIKCQREM